MKVIEWGTLIKVSCNKLAWLRRNEAGHGIENGLFDLSKNLTN